VFEGTVTKEEGGAVIIAIPGLGEISFSQDEIEAIE